VTPGGHRPGRAADGYRRRGSVPAGALAGGCRGARRGGAAAWVRSAPLPGVLPGTPAGAGCRHGWRESGQL